MNPGDEVIIPSFTFVSTANAFVLRGAKIIFADSEPNTPNINLDTVEELITNRTKALIVVHYAGIACDMKKAKEISNKYNLLLIEDAAQAIDSYYNNYPLGCIGNFATFSFHETKNIISGEGGMLVVNDKKFQRRAEIIWEKGTNRAEFFRGEVNKYGWVDIGSSFLPSELTASFLYAQLENIKIIQNKRLALWNFYYKSLSPLQDMKIITLPFIPSYAKHNAHLFYFLCKDHQTQQSIIQYLKSKGILAVFHYLPLHESLFYSKKHDGRSLPNAKRYSDTIIRLPLFYELSEMEQQYIIKHVFHFFNHSIKSFV